MKGSLVSRYLLLKAPGVRNFRKGLWHSDSFCLGFSFTRLAEPGVYREQLGPWVLIRLGSWVGGGATSYALEKSQRLLVGW